MSFKDFCKHVDAMYTEGNALRRRIDELERAIRTTEEEHERLMTQHAAATQKLDEIVIEQNRLMERSQRTQGLPPNNPVETQISNDSNADKVKGASNGNSTATNDANASTSPTVTQTKPRPSLSSVGERPASSGTDRTNKENANTSQAGDLARTGSEPTTSSRPRRSAREAGIKMREDMQRDFPYTNMGRDKHKTPKKKAEE